jgi:hypothetical protein
VIFPTLIGSKIEGLKRTGRRKPAFLELPRADVMGKALPASLGTRLLLELGHLHRCRCEAEQFLSSSSFLDYSF